MLSSEDESRTRIHRTETGGSVVMCSGTIVIDTRLRETAFIRLGGEADYEHPLFQSELNAGRRKQNDY